MGPGERRDADEPSSGVASRCYFGPSPQPDSSSLLTKTSARPRLFILRVHGSGRFLLQELESSVFTPTAEITSYFLSCCDDCGHFFSVVWEDDSQILNPTLQMHDVFLEPENTEVTDLCERNVGGARGLGPGSTCRSVIRVK